MVSVNLPAPSSWSTVLTLREGLRRRGFCRAPGRHFPGAGIPMAADGSREPAGANALLAAMDQEIGGFA
jgi:hypothetical protein